MLLKHEDYRKIAPHINSKDEALELLNNIYPLHKTMLGIIIL